MIGNEFLEQYVRFGNLNCINWKEVIGAGNVYDIGDDFNYSQIMCILSGEMNGILDNPTIMPFVTQYKMYQNLYNAYKLYQSGERNPGYLYLEASGLKSVIIRFANSVHEMYSNRDIVFYSDLPWYERVASAYRIGWFAINVRNIAAAGYFGVKSALKSRSMELPNRLQSDIEYATKYPNATIANEGNSSIGTNINQTQDLNKT